MRSAVQIVDPGDLTEQERSLAARLLEVPPGEFDELVDGYVTRPDDTLRHVLYSGGVAQETLAALGRLHAEAVRREREHGPHSRIAEALRARTILIAHMRRDLRPFVNLAAADAAGKGTRHRAEQVLGRARYPELRQVMRDLDDGMTEDEAFAAHQARIAGRREIAEDIDRAAGR